MVSSSLTPSQLNSGAGAGHRHHTSLIVGLLFGLGIPIVLGIIFAMWMLRRRGQVQAEGGYLEHYHMFIPRPWMMFKRTDHGAGPATQDDGEFNPLIRSVGSPSRSLVPSPEPDDQEKLLDDVSSARSTYNTSPAPSSPAPSYRKQRQTNAARSGAQGAPPASDVPVALGELPPAAHPDTSINNLIRYSEDDALNPHDLPPPYETISARQSVVLDSSNV